MYISLISYKSNPQTFTGFSLRKTVLAGMIGLAGLGVTAEKVAAQTKALYHAVDSVGIGNARGLKLYVASVMLIVK